MWISVELKKGDFHRETAKPENKQTVPENLAVSSPTPPNTVMTWPCQSGMCAMWDWKVARSRQPWEREGGRGWL